MRQAWITKTVLHEVDALAVELQHLVNAHNNACLSIHTAGMVALVVEPAEIPETLSLDQSRLGLLRTEFAYLSLASTMMAILKNLGRNYPSVSFCIACPWMPLSKVFDSLCVWQAIGNVSEMFVAGVARDMDVPKAVDTICDVMLAAEMPPMEVVHLGQCLRQSAMPTDAVHMLM